MSRRFVRVVLGTLISLTFASCEQPTDSQPRGLADVTAPALTYFADRTAFLGQYPGLALEDFEAGQVADGDAIGCPGPVDASSDNSCFAAGAIKPGIQFNSDHATSPDEGGSEVALVGANFGNTEHSKQLVADFAGDAFIIDFSTDVAATGMELVSYSPDVCEIDVYGRTGALLGSTTAPCTREGAFWGVSASEPIARIKIHSPSDQFEGADNISFGTATQPVAPVAKTGGPYTGTAGSAVHFDGTGSFDPGGAALTYEWDFGDGTTHGAGATVDHTYDNDGVFTVTLTVSSGTLTGSATTTATIGKAAQPPVANAGGPYTGIAGTPIEFDGSGSTDPDGGTLTFSWDFGDGSPAGEGVQPTHTYAHEGGYGVVLTVSNGTQSSSATTMATILIAPVAPIAHAGGPYVGTEGSPVHFDGSASSDPQNRALTYRWNFGDGSPEAEGVEPSHTYARAGLFTVTLTVSNGSLTNSATTTATIARVAVPPIANAGGPYAGTEGSPVHFDGSRSSDPDGGTLTYRWEFGDGSEGEGAQPSHTYTRAATYTVTLTVSNASLSSVATTAAVIAALAPPVARAGGPYSGVEGGSVRFDGSGSYDPAGAALTYRWNFGDGTWGYGRMPSHTYADNGSYAVTLTVTAGGRSSAANAMAVIANVAPVVGAIDGLPVDPLEVETSVTGTLSFSDPGSRDTHTGTFDWGDGSTSAAAILESNGSGSASASHSYTTAGVYTVTVAVIDKDGAVAGSSFEFVVVFNPVAGFVTGGGWIMSPPGAYTPNPSLTGKATFGFVARYQKGATIPTGNTEFRFHAAGLDFHSTSYDWLVVSSKVQYKGSGTINGSGDYGFLLSAVDADFKDKGLGDTFRMKIWNKNTGAIIYDNNMGNGDGTPATTVLGGGSIVIHQ